MGRAGLNASLDQVQWVANNDADGTTDVASPEVGRHDLRVRYGRKIYDMRVCSMCAIIIDAVVRSSRPRFMSQQRVHSTKVAMGASYCLCIHYPLRRRGGSEFSPA